MITLRHVEEARERVSGVVRPTPVDRSDTFSRMAGRPVLLKAEHLQRTGSFKIRGAYNLVSTLPAGVDVVAASAGNHAQGVALAASLSGRRSTIFMPTQAPLPKVEATRAYGAEVRLVGDGVDDALSAAHAHAEECGAAYVHPFDDERVIAGQGTIGLELVDDVDDLGDGSAVAVPFGGGGLLSGIATALGYTRRSVRVVGVEVEDRVATLADGIAVKAPSELTGAHIEAFVDDVVRVSDEEISQTMLLLLERSKAVVEPAGAAALAAVLAGKVGGRGSVVALLSGGNVDPLLLTKLIDHGLSAAGRYLVLRIVLADHPGALAELTAAVAALGLNVLDVEHHRAGASVGLDEVEVLLTVETRDPGHRSEVVDALRRQGLRVDLVR
ncbi:MAG TPA: pyridoxal-phosphate dependent enzyme [Acidimicrobiales bacterium]|nr:pyridoxal-phosphate dependent enzyme [Acidimicrobiales bacterium]